MQASDYATVAVAVMTIVGGFAAGVRWLVKHYLNELKPNGGSSVKDSIDRLERQVEEIYRILLTRNKPQRLRPISGMGSISVPTVRELG